MFDQREELPLLPFGNPIGFVPASRGGVNLKSNISEEELDAAVDVIAAVNAGIMESLNQRVKHRQK